MRRHHFDPLTGWMYYGDGLVEAVPKALLGHPRVAYAWIDGVHSWAVRTLRIEPEDVVITVPP
jgi:hypothetical protein